MHSQPIAISPPRLDLPRLRRRNSPDLARADIDEAWILAESGPMPLFQADITPYHKAPP